MTLVSLTTWEGNASTVWHEQFLAGLEASLKLFDQACQQAQVATTEYAQIIDHPSDLENSVQSECRDGYGLRSDPAMGAKDCELQ
jgi:hypothetical protein